MTARSVSYAKEALRAMARMPRNTRDLIRDKLVQYAENPATLANNVKKLQGFDDRYRLRVGDWRVIFDVEGNVIMVAKVVPRGRAYERLT